MSELSQILTTFVKDLFAILAIIPDVLVTGSPEQVLLKVGLLLVLLFALFVFCIRMPLSATVSPSVSLLMIVGGLFFWVIGLVTAVIALGRVDLRALLDALRA